MTRRKKLAYCAVVGLAILGVLIDRLTNGATSGVASAVAGGASPVIAPGTAAEAAASRVSIRPAEFPTPVAQAGLLNAQQRDPFEISDTALAYLKPPTLGTSAPVAGASDRATGESFEESHRLEAILHAAGETVVVVDGILIRNGQTLDGCRLERIQIRAAIFTCADGETELFLDELLPGVSTAPAGASLSRILPIVNNDVDDG